jgi:cytochrome P450
MSLDPTHVPLLDGFDPLSEEFLADPYPILERARRQCPVFFDPVPPNLMDRAFIGLDPPFHTVSRKHANKGFNRSRVAALADDIRRIANELIDTFADDGRCDSWSSSAIRLAAYHQRTAGNAARRHAEAASMGTRLQEPADTG